MSAVFFSQSKIQPEPGPADLQFSEYMCVRTQSDAEDMLRHDIKIQEELLITHDQSQDTKRNVTALN